MMLGRDWTVDEKSALVTGFSWGMFAMGIVATLVYYAMSN